MGLQLIFFSNPPARSPMIPGKPTGGLGNLQGQDAKMKVVSPHDFVNLPKWFISFLE
jgi:hypothetical protein